MALESANTIWGLNSANPPGGDLRSEGDNHIRLLKSVLQATFLMDEIGNRPAAGTEDRIFFSTDEQTFYRDTGAAWEEFCVADLSELLDGDIYDDTDSPVTLVATDGGKIIFADTTNGDITFELPTEATAGKGWRIIIIKIAAANDVIVEDDASATVDTIEGNGDAWMFATDATNWYGVFLNESFTSSHGSTHASAYLSSDQSLSQNVFTKVIYDVEDYDVGSNFASGAYTVPVDGKYVITGGLMAKVLGDGHPCDAALYKNDTAVRQVLNTNAGNSTTEEAHAFAAILDLEADDVIDLRIKVETSGDDIAGGSTKNWIQFARLI